METNQGELRRRLRAGAADAFGELFDAYARSVYNHAYRLTGDWSAAEDIVSLTFLEAWRLRERASYAASRTRASSPFSSSTSHSTKGS